MLCIPVVGFVSVVKLYSVRAGMCVLQHLILGQTLGLTNAIE